MLGVVAGLAAAIIVIFLLNALLAAVTGKTGIGKSDWWENAAIACTAIAVLAAVIWIVIIGYAAFHAETARPQELVRHTVTTDDERRLQVVETVLTSGISGGSDTRAFDLAEFRAHCTEIRRAHALSAYGYELSRIVSSDNAYRAIMGRDDARLQNRHDFEMLDFRDIPVQRDGYFHPFRTVQAIWPDITPNADSPLVRLADALLTHDTASLEAAVNIDLEPITAESTMSERRDHRAIRAAASEAMDRLEQSDTVLDGGPDPNGLCR